MHYKQAETFALYRDAYSTGYNIDQVLLRDHKSPNVVKECLTETVLSKTIARGLNALNKCVDSA